MKTYIAAAVIALSAILACSNTASANWMVTVVDPTSTTVSNISVAESLLNSPPAGSTIFHDNPATLDYGPAFPGIADGDDFALRATGVVEGLSGPTSFTFYENSDDGFKFTINGSTIASSGGSGSPSGTFGFDGTTGGTNVTSVPVTLNNGDQLVLDYFERNGGQYLHFQFNDGNGAFVGAPGTGFQVVPEPSSFILCGLGVAGLFLAARRRRNAAVLALLLIVAAWSTNANAAGFTSIGVQFQGGGTGLGSSDIAGLYTTQGGTPQSNYNVLGGNSFSSVGLNNNLGLSSGATLTATAGGTYQNGTPSGTDETLNSGLVNGTDSNGVTFTISNIPYAHYSLIVYELDNNARTEGTSVNGGTQVWLEGPPNGNSAGYVDNNAGTPYTYLQATSTTNTSPTVGADYVKFDLLTGSTLNFNVIAPGSLPGDGNGNVFVSGFQIIQSPEPSSFVLCGLGVAGLFLAARRRRKA